MDADMHVLDVIKLHDELLFGVKKANGYEK
jgi:hypothetical protein